MSSELCESPADASPTSGDSCERISADLGSSKCSAPILSQSGGSPLASGSIATPGVSLQDKSICVIGEFAGKLDDVIRACGYTTGTYQLVSSQGLQALDPAR